MNRKEHDKICKGHSKRYHTEMEYRGAVAYERARLAVAQQLFLEVPSADNFRLTEKHMVLYQNIRMNCSWNRGDDE